MTRPTGIKTTVFVAASIVLGLSTAAAAEPGMVPLQGFLTDSAGDAIDGSHRLKFTLFDALTDGAGLYVDDYDAVDIDNGHFIVYLGSQIGSGLDLSLFRDVRDVWVEVVIDGTETMSPRMRLSSVPYAGYAQYCGGAETASDADNSARLQGRAAKSFADSIHNHAFDEVLWPAGFSFLTVGTCPTGFSEQGAGQYIRLGDPNLTPVARDLVSPGHSHTAGNLILDSAGGHDHGYDDYYWSDTGKTGAYGTPLGDEVGERLEALNRRTTETGEHDHTFSGSVGSNSGPDGDVDVAVTGHLGHIVLRLCVKN